MTGLLTGSLQERLQALFRQSIVKIVTSTNIRGTGFFVAPGLVLTCTHVLLSEKSLQLPDVTVFWNQQSYTAKIERMLDRTYPDIALLSVSCPEHPYVSLDEDLLIPDKLYCYGYPDDHQDGDSVTLEYEGPSDEQTPLLKLKFGQVRPALSGAPLLNLRTGRVCGIVKRTLDRDSLKGGRAIPIKIVLQEFEQVKVAQQKIGEAHNPWYQLLEELHNPTRLPHETTHYFSHLSTFLEMEGQWFLNDFKQGTIYTPEQEYFEKLVRVLATHNRALLMGQSAAGKTVLAITFARHLQESAGYTVCYKDVKQAEAGDGRKWYTLMREHDRPGLLYILDNCHLLSREVDEFCHQWKSQPPANTQCLLISRVSRMKLQNQQQLRSEEAAYIQMFSDEEKVQVRAEDTFLHIIEQYMRSVAALSPPDTSYDATLKSDNREKLEKQHAHNLVISRSLLDTWHTQYTSGIRHPLSEVKLEDTYQILENKYFSVYGTKLAMLCVLQRYEIRVHMSFVEKELLPQEIKHLETEKLLIHSRVDGYGQLYDLVLHPAAARELFLAYVYNRYGSVRQENINPLAIDVLESYLKSRPSNFTTVYDSLARYKQDDILKHLLSNRELQTTTINQFNRETVVDAIRYAYRVAKFDATIASTVLEKIVRLAGIEGICAKLLNNTFQDTALLLQYIQMIDSRLAIRIANALDAEQLARQVQEETIQSLFRLIRTLQKIAPSQAQTLFLALPVEILVAKTTLRNLQDFIKQLQAYHYPDDRLMQFIESLAMPQLAQQHEQVSLQSLFWTLQALKKVSLVQAQTLLQCIPLSALSLKASTSNLGSIDQMIQVLQSFGYSVKQVRTFAETLDIAQVAQQTRQTRQGTLDRLTSLLSTLKPISMVSMTQLLDMLTPKDYANLFQRSSLHVVGKFLQRQYAHRHVRDGYALFQNQYLQHHLDTEPLDKLNEFLDYVSKIRQEGARLARHALELLVTSRMVDITERLASADLQQYTRLLYHAGMVDNAYFSRFLVPLHNATMLQDKLAKSDLHTIQWLIFNVANNDITLVQPIQQALQAIHVVQKFDEASLRDIGLFLWNIYSYIEKQMAQNYSIYVDQHLPVQQFAAAQPEDVCFLLWNITSITNSSSLRLCDASLLQGLSRHNWHKEVGWSAVLTGIVAIAQMPNTQHSLLLADKDSTTMLDSIALMKSLDATSHLSRWFTTSSGGRNPYFLALALQGLRTHDEDTARSIIRKALPLSSALYQLKAARTSAITPRSIFLIEGTQQWLEQLSEQDEGNREVQ